jgi:immune inhibitor InhA-like protein
MRAARLLIVAALLALAIAGSAQAASVTGVGVLRDVGPDYNDGKALPFAADTARKARVAARVARARSTLAAIGDRQLWLGLDDAFGFFYLKNYTLRVVSNHIEIWVASDEDEISSDLAFPAGDCRNDERVTPTDAQLEAMANEFDGNIFPKESQAFSVPPARDGTLSFAADLGLPADYWQGEGDNIVVLVDNVRDSNFYDFPNNQTYIGGFFTSFFNELTDRNVMTIDGFDWVHRTGANPPGEPVPGDICASRPARPYLYEGTFAHEYQHLLEYYEDPDETLWINEGLSMYAEALTGYVDPSIPISRIGFEGALQCFLGWGSHQTTANPNPRPGGPENSLTYWGDQGDGDELLCDYGAAESFMHVLADRYGVGVISKLHRADQDGLASVRTVLRGAASVRNRREILHDWAATVALDSLIDHEWQLAGGPRSRYRTASLDLDVDWDNEDAYSTPGAPPNGSDYVRLRGGGGNYVSAAQIRSITFDGARFHRPDPIEWAVDDDPPLHPGDSAFYSGSGINFDRAIVYEVAVPKQNATLRFDTLYETEPFFDYGFVQVSTNGGKTYQSLANDITTNDVDPTAFELVVNNLPGLNGNSGGGDTPEWVTTSFDLSAYAGRTILVSFRYITDSSVDGAGWWIDDVRIGGQLIADGESFAGWKPPTGVRPIPVKGFTVQLVAYSTEKPHRAVVHRLKLANGFRGRLGGAALRSVLDGDYDVVAAIVTYNEPTELLNKYAPYRLWIAADAVQQPGGAQRVLQRDG